MIPRMKSFFYWEGEAQSEEEVLLIGKTRDSKVDKLVETVKELHSYATVNIIMGFICFRKGRLSYGAFFNSPGKFF